MKVQIDSRRCVGHALCHAKAPEVFDVDDEGYSVLLIDGEIPAELEDKTRKAVKSCPEYAITIAE